MKMPSMKPEPKPVDPKHLSHDARRHHQNRVVEVALAGTVAGAATGAVAGPPGAIAGAVLGGIAGALAGEAMDEETNREEIYDAYLDAAIGVTGDGEIGAASPDQPETKRHSVSPASAGVSGGGGGGSHGTIPRGA